ncbi:MAG TPA: MFS transporter [Candidatus Limnocylindria bacterium]|nr:MFS transporter [Candidatus Limnocylindria bacterium]
MTGWRQLLLPDTAPLRESRSFRLLWVGQLISLSGSQLRLVALPYQIFLLTGSSFAVGLIGVFQAVPLLLLSLFGGVIADAVDRRRLLLVTQTGLAVVSLALAVATQAGLASVPLLYVLTAVGACFSALDNPTRASIAPTLVERRLIRAAMALNQTIFQFALVFGSVLAGLVIARFGLAGAYWLDVISFVASFIAVWMMRTPPRAPAERQPVLRSLAEGVRYLGATRILLATMALDFLATFFGSPRALFPYYAERVFHVGPEGLGLLYASMGAGALVAAVASGWTARVQRQGLTVLVAVAVWGLSIAVFGVLDERWFVPALALLAIANGADAVSSIFRGTILQMIVPDSLRGRLNAINIMFVLGGPQLGQFESGAVAALWSPVASVVSGGVACVASVFAIAAWIPEIRRFRAHRDEVADAG